MTRQTTSALRDATEKCPVTQTLRVIARRWKPVVIYDLLRDWRLRYTALRERLVGVASKVLTQQLSELVADGVLARSPASGAAAAAAARVEYALTDRGRTLGPVVAAIHDWGSQHRAAVGSSRPATTRVRRR